MALPEPHREDFDPPQIMPARKILFCSDLIEARTFLRW
jgi:hypothetical protein